MKWLLLTLLYLLPQTIEAQIPVIREQLDSLLAEKKLQAGIALYDFQSRELLTIDGESYFPMQSVFKFPIALAVLQGVDQGRWSLSDSLYIRKSDLLENTWSPIRERYPQGEVRLTLADLIRYTVSQSDNNGCDILLRLLGGAPQAEAYLDSIGLGAIDIRKNEAEMHLDWQVQFLNRTTPIAMIELLRLFEQQQLLKPETFAFLWQTLAATSTGSIRTKLPANAVVAHKTGSSGQNEAGITAATNDVGILVLPDGRHLAYALFITASHEPDSVNYGVIAEIAHLLYHSTPK